MIVLISVSDYTFEPCVFDSASHSLVESTEEDLLDYVSEYFMDSITMEQLLDEGDFRVENCTYYKSVSTIREEKINDILS
jgi:hypothetical protein